MPKFKILLQLLVYLGTHLLIATKNTLYNVLAQIVQQQPCWIYRVYTVFLEFECCN